MGSRGSNSGGSRGKIKVTGLTDFDGSNIDLSAYPLQYGGNDAAVSGNVRKVVEEQETKRLKAKVEYLKAFDADGNMVDVERRGGSGSVRMTYNQVNANTITHNHPREAGVLGGTFSQADINNFANYRSKTMRASAKEGTYSISKGKNFDAEGTKAHVRSVIAKAEANHKARGVQTLKDYREKKITWDQYLTARNDSFNRQLVEMHNGYAEGAKKYGYTYTLERRGNQ